LKIAKSSKRKNDKKGFRDQRKKGGTFEEDLGWSNPSRKQKNTAKKKGKKLTAHEKTWRNRVYRSYEEGSKGGDRMVRIPGFNKGIKFKLNRIGKLRERSRKGEEVEDREVCEKEKGTQGRGIFRSQGKKELTGKGSCVNRGTSLDLRHGPVTKKKTLEKGAKERA